MILLSDASRPQSAVSWTAQQNSSSAHGGDEGLMVLLHCQHETDALRLAYDPLGMWQRTFKLNRALDPVLG